MKILIISLLCLSSLTTGFSQNTSEFDWLIGIWERQNMRAGTRGYEVWEKDNGTLKGLGIRLKGADTVFVEKLYIKRTSEGNWVYVADVVENPNPVAFAMTTIFKDGFACENLSHDFPKQIAYKLTGQELTAITSGDGKEIQFHYKRIVQ